ncbi:MAG: SUMF1/EgtB/PvdO family nonheme iron enzyme [Bryobacteraceae bacterium]
MPKAARPRVFISSTKEDLESYRAAARDAVLQAGRTPLMMEYFTAQDKRPPYAACMKKVREADLVVVIVAHRYGWIPDDQPKPGGKSITWLECEEARRRGKEVMAFLADEKHPWAPELREPYRLTKAIEEDRYTRKLADEVNRNRRQLDKFKAWLRNLGFCAAFGAEGDLKAAILAALFGQETPQHNPGKYLQWLIGQTSKIDMRGLQVGSGKAHSFPIEDLYIPLRTVTSAGTGKPEEPGRNLSDASPLETALKHRTLVIVGDPGSGKTTFLRRIGCELAGGTAKRLARFQGFPILIRVAELEEHIEHCWGNRTESSPAAKESPAWLGHFLGRRSEDQKWELDREFFEQKLGEATTVVLLDGLDEAPSVQRRESMARLFESAVGLYRSCRFVVTTRPGAYTGRSVLTDFQQVQIGELGMEAIEAFLRHWSSCLFVGNAAGAKKHAGELGGALRARVEIRRMARNPLMLTALAVVHWNDKRLPEQRAELYESIVNWLAESREQRPGREPAKRCLALLGHLALGMQNRPRGRLTEVATGVAAKMIAPNFRRVPESEKLALAQSFLEQEEVDSGIVVKRGATLRFWHLTFQEYLAGRTIAGLPDATQQKLLLGGDRLYRPEWREVVLLMAGTLLVRQGAEKVDGFLEALLEKAAPDRSLASRARCAGLIGAILNDLRPLAYPFADPRYGEILQSVLEIFDPAKAEAIDLKVRVEAAEALGQAGDPRLREDNWVTMEKGTFRIGEEKKNDPEAAPHEAPIREVKLKAFQIGRYPVTVEEFRRFVEDDGYQKESLWKDGGFGEWTEPGEWEEQRLHPNRPVVNVTWYEAAAYCAWDRGRLPAEAEWERVARGKERRRYPWGNELPDTSRANYDETKIGKATPVGLFPRGATPEGVQDLAGNVWEWVADWYEKDQGKVVRGGSWINVQWYLRAAVRGGLVPEGRVYDFGFRCAREVS